MIKGKLDADHPRIMISMFYLQTSGPQDRRKYMLEMENITFSDPKQNRMCT
jgi:hypothetical protein